MIQGPPKGGLLRTGGGGVSGIIFTAGTVFSGGISTLGNTAGTTLMASNQLLLVGGNNITLSGSANAASMTVTISGVALPPIATAAPAPVSTVASTGTITRYAPEDHQHIGVNSVGISGGNTSGTTGVGPGRLVLAGGDNITLSQATDATGRSVTIIGASGGAAAYSAGISTGGNTSGDTLMASNQLVLAGGNNITLSGSSNGGSVSVTISAGTLGGAPIATAAPKNVSTVASTGTIARFAPEDHQHVGVNSAGVSTGGNTLGATGVGPGRLVFVGTNVTLSQGTDATGATITISGGAAGTGGGGNSMSVLTNMPWVVVGTNPGLTLTHSQLSQRPFFMPLYVPGSIVPATIEAWISRASNDVSLNVTEGWAFYTISNSTKLNLLSSAVHAISLTASTEWSGRNAIPFVELSGMTVTPGQYVLAHYWSFSNGNSAVGNVVMLGSNIAMPIRTINSGTDQTVASNVASNIVPFWGPYSVTTAAFPATIDRSDIAVAPNVASGPNGVPFVMIRQV